MDEERINPNRVKPLIYDLVFQHELKNKHIIDIEDNNNNIKILNNSTNTKRIKMTNDEIEKKIKLYKEQNRIFILGTNKYSDIQFIENKIKEFDIKIQGFKKEIETNGDKKFEVYQKKENIITRGSSGLLNKEHFFQKLLGTHEKSSLDKKIIHKLLLLYKTLLVKTKKGEKENTLIDEIVELEYNLKLFNIKKMKKVSSNKCSIFYNFIYNALNLCENEMKKVYDGSTLTMKYFLNKNIYNQCPFIRSLMFRYYDSYELITTSNTKIDIFSSFNSDLRGNYLENNKMAKYVINKNHVVNIFSKYWKDIVYDNKFKQFISYLIVCYMIEKCAPLSEFNRNKKFSIKRIDDSILKNILTI